MFVCRSGEEEGKSFAVMILKFAKLNWSTNSRILFLSTAIKPSTIPHSLPTYLPACKYNKSGDYSSQNCQFEIPVFPFLLITPQTPPDANEPTGGSSIQGLKKSENAARPASLWENASAETRIIMPHHKKQDEDEEERLPVTPESLKYNPSRSSATQLTAIPSYPGYSHPPRPVSRQSHT